MLENKTKLGALLGLLMMIWLTAIAFIASLIAPLPFIGFDIFDVIARVLPGDILTFGIEALVNTISALGFSVRNTAKSVEGLMSLLILQGVGAVAGAVYATVLARRDPKLPKDDSVGLWTGLILALFAVTISNAVNFINNALLGSIWNFALFLGWGFALSRFYKRLVGGYRLSSQVSEEKAEELLSKDAASRRQFLIRMGGATAAITVVGAGLGSALARRENFAGSGGIIIADDGSFVPAPGTRLEYPSLSDHYRIDINLSPVPIKEAEWMLNVSGLVDNPGAYSLNQIRALPAHSEFLTMMCISNEVGGDLIGTTMWTGASGQDFLDLIGVQDDAAFLRISSIDGFFEYVAIDLIREDERIMFAYEWDGQPLKTKHGFPLRIHIPDHYGMKQPKWITKIEVVDRWQGGYWVVRGWDPKALIRMTSVIDTVYPFTQDGQKQVAIGGISFAGDRGVAKVEIQVDEGEWEEVELKDPLSDRTWVVWRYDWEFEAGFHIFTVRATDKNGDTQITSLAPPHPSGATGLHRVTERL